MERMSHFRARSLLLLFICLVGFFVYRLYDEQVIKTGGGKVDNATVYTTLTRVKAARGDILDSNGNVLVGNRASYDIIINHYVLTSSEKPNESIYQLVKLCQELGIEYTDNFPITKERPFTYTLDQFNSTWQGYFQTYLPSRGDLDSDITAPLLIEKLRSSYDIPEEWSDEDARLVLGIRYELSLRNEVRNLANYVFITDASDEARFAIQELSIPGLTVEASTVREYHTKYAAHVLGYTGPMDKDEWEYYKELGYSMDAEVGKTGFEAVFEEYLHGTDGWRVDKVAPDGTLVESYYREGQEPKAGMNIEVTIDINLQMVAEDQLALRLEELRANENPNADGVDAEGAAVVVMEVKTGKILACASYPSYDPSTFFENYNQLLEADFDPLFNRALSATYPPGSTYKMSMVVAAINAKRINMADTIEDLGKFRKYEDLDFAPTCLVYTSQHRTHGKINAAQALCVSCNYFFYELADSLPIAVIDETAKGLGLGEPTGVELPEKTGYRANAETKKKFHQGDDAGWYAADQVLAGIGQSENKFTPLQLCVYTCTLANRGKRFAATFLNRVVSTDYRSLVEENQPELLSTMEISDDAYYAYTQGMQMVTSHEEGTAYRFFKDYPIPVAAKTGTAETDKKDASDNGAFICYAPANDPQIAIAVYGERVGHGSSMAIVAKSLLDVYFEVGEIGSVVTYENRVA